MKISWKLCKTADQCQILIPVPSFCKLREGLAAVSRMEAEAFNV